MNDRFNYRLLITIQGAIAAAVLLALCWYLIDVLLLTFAAVLLALLLDGVAAWLQTHTAMPTTFAKAVTVVGFILLLLGAVGWLGPLLLTAIDQFAQNLPPAWSRLYAALQRYDAVADLAQRAYQNITETLLTPGMFSRLGGWFSGTLGSVISFLVIVILGLYLSWEPQVYIAGLIRLTPISRRARLLVVLQTMGAALQRWLVARFLSMAVVGALTYAGLWWLALPAAPPLAALAALLSFIPNIGPVLSAVPAVVIGFLQQPLLAGYVVALYTGVQTVESYLITPLIQRSALQLPPAFLLVMQLALGMLFGLIGLALATPLAVALVVAIRLFYIEDVLGDRADGP